MGFPALVRMLRSGARSGGIHSARRYVAETSTANRRLFVAARGGGFAAAHRRCEIVFRPHAEPGPRGRSSEAVGRATAAKRRFLFVRAKRWSRDLRRESAVVCGRAKRRFRLGALGKRNCFLSRADAVRFGRSRESEAQVAAAKRRLLPRSNRGRCDFRRLAAVVFAHAKQRFRIDA